MVNIMHMDKVKRVSMTRTIQKLSYLTLISYDTTENIVHVAIDVDIALILHLLTPILINRDKGGL